MHVEQNETKRFLAKYDDEDEDDKSRLEPTHIYIHTQIHPQGLTLAHTETSLILWRSGHTI